MICIDSGYMVTALWDMLTQASLSIKSAWPSLIYACMKAPKIYSYFQAAGAEAQLKQHLPSGIWNDILETRNYGILKLEHKRFLCIRGLLVWQGTNHVL